jgi:hypothetical protein
MMLRLRWLGGVLLGALFLMPCSLWALDEVTFEALIDKDKVEVGENVQYLITINFGMGTMAPSITPPTFNQFTVLNEYQTIQPKGEGPERYQVLKKIWLLQPTEPGKISIAAAIITYQDPTTNLLKNGKTQVQFLTVVHSVVKETPATAAPAAAPNTPVAQAKLKMFWIISGGVGAVLLLLILVIVFHKPSAPKVIHEDTALRALDKAIGHAEEENLEAYYVALSRAFLDYLRNKFGIDGDMLATPALLAKMKEFGFGPKILHELETFLKTSDKAKFGGYAPNEDEMIILHGINKNFIEAGRKIKIKAAKPKKKKDEDEE